MLPTPAELRGLVDQGLGVEDICAHYGRSRSTIYRWFEQLGVTPPPRASWALTVTKQRLARLYQRLGTLEAVAAHEGVSKGQVERAMEHHGVARRRAGSWSKPPRPRPPVEELRRVYGIRGSVRGVADHYQVGVRTAHGWLTDPDVNAPLRPPGRPRERP
jgi:Homeodomain-like domain-containing protein